MSATSTTHCSPKCDCQKICDPEPNRTYVLSAAADLFAKRGIHAVTLGQVAKRAHISESALAQLFESKDVLARAVLKFERAEVYRVALSPKIIAKSELRQAAKLYAAWLGQRLDERLVRIRLAYSVDMPELLRASFRGELYDFPFPSPKTPTTRALIERVRRAQADGQAIAGRDPAELVRVLDDALIGDAVLRALGHPDWNAPPPSFAVNERIVCLWLAAVCGGVFHKSG